MAPANKTNPSKTGETASPVKVLLFDVECSPNVSLTWGKYDQDVVQFIKERQIISFAWKWLGEPEVFSTGLPDFKGYTPLFQNILNPKNDNKALMGRLRKLFSEADIIVGHNIDNFDEKRSNTDMLISHFTPPPPHKTVDTLKVARKKFQFNSNKLGDLGERLGLGKKVAHPGIAMWIGCMQGDPGSWEHMLRYNRGDVTLLEKIYLRMRPWMTNHPSMVMKDNHLGCPVCRSVYSRPHGWLYFKNGAIRRYECRGCGHWLPNDICRKLWNLRPG